jgi:hypothetical protein
MSIITDLKLDDNSILFEVNNNINNPIKIGLVNSIRRTIISNIETYCIDKNSIIFYDSYSENNILNDEFLIDRLILIPIVSDLDDIDYENIVTNGLTYLLDAGFIPSYPLSSSVWYNLSNTGSSTSLVNGPTYNSSNSGSIVFNGTNQYALTSNLLNPTTYPNESVFVWFYPTSAGQIVSELGQATIDFGYHDSNIEISGSGVISFATWGGNLTNKVVSSAKSFNTWYQLGFTYSGTTLTAYINGASIGTATLTRQPPTALYFGLCAIDSITNMGTPGYAGGRLGNFIFYNRGLSATEVLQNYNAQKGRFGL